MLISKGSSNFDFYFFWLFGMVMMLVLLFFSFLVMSHTVYVPSVDLANHYMYSMKVSKQFFHYLFDVATYPPLFHMFIFLLSYVFDDVF